MEARQRGEQDDDTAQHHHHADDLVDELDAVGAELRAYLVDEPRQAPPPQQRTADDAHEARNHLHRLVQLQAEGELGIEGHEEEDDQGIAQRDKECRHGVVRQRAFLLAGRAQLPCGVGAVGVVAESQEEQAARYLQIEAVGVVAHKIDHQSHAQARDARINHVAQGRTAARDKTIPPPLVQRTLHTEHTHWPHGRRGNNAYQQALKDNVKDIRYGVNVEWHQRGTINNKL